MDTAICKEVIISTIARRGQGTKHSPIRVITQVFEKDGTLIAENDPHQEPFWLGDLLHFARWLKDKGLDVDAVSPAIVYDWLDSLDAQ